MTSNRGQNVSVLQRPGNDTWEPFMTVFTDAGGSLRSAPRSTKNTFPRENSCGQNSTNFLNSAVRNRDRNSVNKYSNVTITNSVSSSSIINSVSRELSPVRWCDREVDGVYLGRSGWMQVQQRSLDDCKEVLYNASSGFSTLPSRNNLSHSDPNCGFDEIKGRHRPVDLPLSERKHIFRDKHERPSKFIQEFESVSPPSVTPIISPPPAFKDDGSDAESSTRSTRSLGKPFFCKKSFPRGSDSQIKKQDSLKSFSSTIPTETNSSSTLRCQRPLNHVFGRKSLEGDHSENISCSRNLDFSAPLAFSGFRSLDNDARLPENKKVSDFFSKDFVNSGKDSDEEEEEDNDVERDERNRKTLTDSSSLGLQSLSCEGSKERKFLSKVFTQMNFQERERQTFDEDYCNIYGTRSPSLDSNSSSTSSCNSSSFFDATLGAKVSKKSRSQQSLKFRTDNSQSKNRRHLSVKRSRSLQLSERKSSNESLLSNDSQPKEQCHPELPENFTGFQIKNLNNEPPAPFPQPLHHVLVTVNGESIPVMPSSSQSLKSLNKITTSGIGKKKLIMEVEKEAKIISEFMNGSRSRVAARNLLMDRYLCRPKNGDFTLKGGSPKNEHDDGFLPANHKQSRPISTNSNFNKKNHLLSWGPNLSRRSSTCPASSTSLFQAFDQGYCKSGSRLFGRHSQDQRKVDRPEDKERERSRLVPEGQIDDCCSERKRQQEILNSPVDWSCLGSRTLKERPGSFLNQNQKIKNVKRQGTEKPTSDPLDLREAAAQRENSVWSSSSSREIRPHNINMRFKGSEKNIDGSALVKSYAVDSDSKVLGELLRCRPGSAPERNFFTSKGVDKRSLSLPRSFLSECYRLKKSYQRNLLALKQQPLETSNEFNTGGRLYVHETKTVPTTPVRDVKFNRSAESLIQIPGIGSPCSSLLRETSFLKPRRLIQEMPSMRERLGSSVCEAALERPKSSVSSSNDIIILPIYKSPLKISAHSSETVLRKFKKQLSLKNLKAKEHLKDGFARVNQESEDESVENSNETYSVASGEISSLQPLENDYGNIPERTHRFRLVRKKGLKNEKYDSHDSGIQILNRGSVESSESQDTDIQEDVDSSFASDSQRRIKFRKHNNGKLVRRSNSDVGDQRLFNGNVKNFRSSKTVWRQPDLSQDSVIFNKYEELLNPRLRRSLSQPVGLNECFPLVRRRCSTLKELTLSEDEKNPRQRNTEDEFLSDSESSVTSLSERKKSLDSLPRTENAVLAEAVWDHVAMESSELPFKAGDVIEVLEARDRNWWWGATAEKTGYFPSAFVRLRVSQADTVEDCLAQMTKGKSASKQLRRGKSLSLLSNDQVRSKIVRELLKTERDFVKILRDVKDGYVIQCKMMTDMFTSAQISTIFSNLEDLLVFQERFLKDLEGRIDREFPYRSCIGEVFLNNVSGFRMYSEYCNSHPMAIATLQELYQENKYCKFFEMCRLKQSLIEIPLDGYLLTPVQRICKYPLQLGELLKYTRPDHPDYKNVEAALETMRSVATLINERKRKMESLEKLAAWQQRVEGWEGDDLIEISTQLIHQGDVVRITSGMWTSNITLFLFDHQIIYCKKDLLKKNVYIYKGRISLAGSDVADLPDGKNQQLGVHIKYGLKISSRLKDKWLVFCCRSSEDKFHWLEALAKEKRLVAQDKEGGLDLPTAAKELAKMAARTKKTPPFKPKGKNKFSPNCDVVFCKNNQPNASKTNTTRRMGTWFTFGGVMKNSKANLRSRAPVHRFT